MLREKTGAGLHDLGPAQPIGLDTHACTDCVAIGGRAHQPDRDRCSARREVVAEHAELRGLPRRHHREIRIAVAVDVEHGKRPAILIEIETDRSRDVVEAALTVVAQKHVALPTRD